MKVPQALLFLLFLTSSLLAQTPPFGGTIFLDPDIITLDDPSSFIKLEDAGQEFRTMYDRRANNWVNENAYLFNATYDDGLSLEIQVNPEFGSVDAARVQAQKYAPVLGQLPTVLRKDAQTVWIHKGVNPFGGGNNNFLIHTGQADLYIRDGILEETLIHEGSHTSLDNPHASSAGWRAAQADDPTFISTYARDYPDREDVAESFLPYLMVRHRADRITNPLKETIENAMPNRIAYFDDQDFDLYPMVTATSVKNTSLLRQSLKILPNPTTENIRLQLELERPQELRVSLFTILGQQIQEIAVDNRAAGRQEWFLTLPGVGTGIYLLVLQSEEEKIVRRLVIQQ